jgi:hypothetical protein
LYAKRQNFGLLDPDADLIQGGGEPAQIILSDKAVTYYRNTEWWWGGILLVLSSVPLIWYFLLDRIRELSGAVSGRDRT